MSHIHMELEKVCPKCGCPHWQTTGQRTADNHSAWQDTDGTWYNGPAHATTRMVCANRYCGWSQTIEKRRGKVESVKKDPT